MTRAVIVALGRNAGMGERRRIESWEAILGCMGVEVEVISLIDAHRSAVAPTSWPDVTTVIRGGTTPESLAWSPRHLIQTLKVSEPDLIIANTARSFVPNLTDVAPTVILDLVDRLSTSYEDRSRIVDGVARRAGFRTLAAAHRRFEARASGDRVIRVAAGLSDAHILNAQWIPNVVQAIGRCPATQPDHDVLFFGNLAYPPNVAALGRLGRMWPLVLEHRPKTTALIAGANPSVAVRRLVRLHGWTLHADFDDLRIEAASARLAVVPLEHTAGIQNKLLEAAAFGLPQVISPQAAAGAGWEVPAVIASSDSDFVHAIVDLLADSRRSEQLAAEALRVMSRSFSAEAGAGRVERLLLGS